MYRRNRKKLKSFNDSIKTLENIKTLDSTTEKIQKLYDNVKYLEEQKELENLYKINKENSEKLDNLINVLNKIDIQFLKKLNQKLDSIKRIRRGWGILASILITILFLFFIFVSPYSPVYQKTKQQKLLNDILQEHHDELISQDDAKQAIEKCEEILKDWEEKHK